MKARRLFVAVALVTAAGAAAAMGCNALLDINPPHVVDDDAGSDGSVVDGAREDSSDSSVVQDAGVDGSERDATLADAGLNLIADPSFVNGCGQWKADGTLGAMPVAFGHDDAHACRVCSDGAFYYEASLAVVQGANVAKIGDTFYAEAWVRKDPDRDAAPAMDLELEIDLDGMSSSIEQQQVNPSQLAITDSWVLMNGYLTVTAADAGQANLITMDVISRTGAPAGTDRCFVIDDVVFRPGKE